MQTLLYTISFLVLCLASHRIGQLFSRIRLPYITGYLFAGVLVGSFGLGLLPMEAAEQLRFIDEIALGVIAFVAGSELYLKDLRSRLRRILWTAGGILVAALVLIGLAIFTLTRFIPFTQGMSVGGRVAVALLGGTVLLALSPPSTIAVIREVRARGPFTSTALGVTVLMDVVIIVLFAVSASLASALLLGERFSLGFAGVLVLDLTLALLLGYAVGRLLHGLLGLRLSKLAKTVLVVALGFLIFELAGHVKVMSAEHLPFEVYIEPLLIALVGGFIVTNFTPHRDQFDEILHDVGPVVYVAFFTLTGIAIKLDILWATLPIAVTLFLVRMAGIYLGAYAGSAVAGATPRQRRLSWMAFITQAGIALGLAREVAVQFPDLGVSFATLIISVVVLNEIFGPLFLKAALKRVGEAQVPEPATPDEVRDALILGIAAPAVALARRLQQHGWRVVMADPDAAQVRRFAAEDLAMRHVPEVSLATLQALVTPQTDAVVALLRDDEANLRACELAYAHFGIPRLVVQAADLSRYDRFRALGALVVDTTSALVNLLDQAVRAPQSAALLLHQDGGREVVQVTVSNPAIDGLYVRDLRLPADVLLLDILREGGSVVPHGNSVLRLRDEVTLLGHARSLEDITLKLGY
jgi:Trk K+ transport system NAD-binding subunit/Kef-type K+ transport system membrane component KefB